MQTFLPYSNFEQSAKSLDYRRLGKQRVETLQILKALSGQSKGWTNHPATRMWKNHELWLIEYGLVICREWINRGYQDTCVEKIAQYRNKFSDGTRPWWLDKNELHLSHQSNLIKKYPAYYKKQFPNVPDNLEYYWPVR